MPIHYPELHKLFCDIVSGRAESYRIEENDYFIAILDTSPVSKGHTLVLPKRTVIELSELSEEEIIGLHGIIGSVSRKIAFNFSTVGISIMQNGGECNSVSYLHIHIIPRFDTVSIWKDDLRDLTELKDVHAILGQKSVD